MNDRYGMWVALLILLTHILVPIYFIFHFPENSLLLIPRQSKLPTTIFTSAFVHVDLEHLLGNLQLLLPGFLGLYFIDRKVALRNYALLFLSSNLMLWLFGSAAIHVGLSGVAIGLGFYVFFSGIFTGIKRNIVISLSIALVQLFVFVNFWREGDGISSESHVFGFLCGTALAWFNYWGGRKYNFS